MMKAAMLRRVGGFSTSYSASVKFNQRQLEPDGLPGRALGGAAAAPAASELLDESVLRAELQQAAARSSALWALRLPRRLARQGRGRRTELPAAAPEATLSERCLDMARRLATQMSPLLAVPLGVLLGWHCLDSFSLGWSEGRM